jgi:hypothetical protein
MTYLEFESILKRIDNLELIVKNRPIIIDLSKEENKELNELLGDDCKKTGSHISQMVNYDCFIVTHPDEIAYWGAIKKCVGIFKDRRTVYGNHLNKDAYEDVAGLYLKTNRICRDISDKKELNGDTLIDLVNYALQILSRKERNAKTNER